METYTQELLGRRCFDGRGPCGGGACGLQRPIPARGCECGGTTQVSGHNPVSTEDVDVVVVGSGTAGTCAALHAAEAGAKVLCIEKRSGLGGTSAFAEGFCGVNTALSGRAGHCA